MTPEFWNNKRVLVTGHTGFKGGWLALLLERLGAKVTGLALDPHTTPSFFEMTNLGAGIHSILGDIRDVALLRSTIPSGRFDAVFHLAAQALVRESYKRPLETYATNVMGTANLLDAIRSSCVQAVVVITSDKCYENHETTTGYVEEDAMGGHDPYSSSKGAAELIVSAYRRSFFQDEEGPKIASARAGNVIGGGDYSEDRLLPDCVRSFQKKQPVPIRNPKAVRSWQHVLEPLDGYLTLAERLIQDGQEFATGWNFGPEETDARSVLWVAETFAKYWGESASIECSAPDGPHEANLLMLNCQKAARLLQWRPRTHLEEAIAWTAQWYREAFSGKDARQETMRQIETFLHREIST